MKAGSLRHRLAFDRPDVVQNETGEEEFNWHHQGTVWAKIEPLRGRESLLANVNLAAFDTRIIVRWAPSMADISTKWRARDLATGTIYNLKNVQHVDHAKRQLEILAQSGANQG